MSEALHFLLRHGYAVLFAAVCAEQAGFPVPALPFLLGMGALAGEGRFGFGMALGIAVLASLPGDWLWYELGRLRGYTVLRVICRIALEAETCVKRTENTFLRHGTGALVLAKFVPGFSTVAPPMAGMLRMPRLRFLALDSA
ncbi:MAG: DedA family protein, partial [Acidobacteria bacterium]|nr:DedA family protein [Acidobacteriota bacterium]